MLFTYFLAYKIVSLVLMITYRKGQCDPPVSHRQHGETDLPTKPPAILQRVDLTFFASVTNSVLTPFPPLPPCGTAGSTKYCILCFSDHNTRSVLRLVVGGSPEGL